MNSSRPICRFCLAFRPLSFGLTIGPGVGLATQNLGAGISLGIIFAVVFGALAL